MRPSSSSGFTSRPSTSHSIRSASRFSQRPSSALSHRPGSSLSQRPTSRLSQRPASRHAQRFTPQLRKLVEQITGLSEDDDEDYEDALDLALRTLEMNRYTGLRVGLDEVESKIEGLVEKAQIKGQDVMATALSETQARLKSAVTEATKDEDEQLIRETLLPDHIHFLLLLAKAADSKTLDAAVDILDSIRNPPPPPHVLTWEEILAEEPLEGDHWRMPSSPSSSSLSSWSDLPPKQHVSDSESEDLPATGDSASREPSETIQGESKSKADTVLDEGPQITFESLKQQQYWSKPSSLLDTPFDFRDPATLGPALASLKGNPVVWISEANAVREVLMALQGRFGYLFQLNAELLEVQIAQTAPVLLHMSQGTFQSLLATFAATSTVLERLRHFVHVVRQREANRGAKYRCRTLAALSEGVEAVINEFMVWCSNYETQVSKAQSGSGPQMIVSLLSLEHKVQAETHATFEVLWLITQKFSPTQNDASNQELDILDPSSSAQYILDQILAYSHSHATMGDQDTADSLSKVFTYALTPLWHSLHWWLKNGAPPTLVTDNGYGTVDGVVHDSEFFIEINDGLLTSGDSWHDACALRSPLESSSANVPECLRAIGPQLLSAGKAVGLLRALGTDDFFYGARGSNDESEWLADWATPSALLIHGIHKDPTSTGTDPSINDHIPPASGAGALRSAPQDRRANRRGFWTEDISTTLAQYLLPLCQSAQTRLNQVVITESHLWDHLRAVEDLYLMRRGDITADFGDILFSRMDACLPWNDFHFLNGAFRDSIAASACSWIDASLVRISYQTTNLKPEAISRTMATLEGLSLDYQVPFPLNYMLGPSSIQSYRRIFVLLLQLRRCKSLLQKMDPESSPNVLSDLGDEGKRMLFGLRAKLVWFVNVFYNHIVTFVLSAETEKLHQALAGAKSLDEMVSLHSAYLRRVLRSCLLTSEVNEALSALVRKEEANGVSQSDTAHQAVMAILDTALVARQYFDPSGNELSVDLSALAMRDERIIEIGRRRKQRLRQSQKRLRRNVISFTSEPITQEYGDSSGDSSDDLDLSYLSSALDGQRLEDSTNPSDSWFGRVEDCNLRLDNLVRLLRRSAETLENATDETLESFGILAFSLEDWDR